MKTVEFRGFISFSHKDEAISIELHKRLEAFQVPNNLRVNNAGHRKLGRFFRDREELAATDQLTGEIRDALAASRSLIVICSLHAARSAWVQKEIETYLSLRERGDIYAVIVGGEPPDCFPPALLSPDLLAVDFRPHADGIEDGFLKLISGMIGVTYGDFKNRVVFAERKRQLRTRAVAIGFAILALLALSGLGTAIFYVKRANDLAVAAISTSRQIGDEAYTEWLNEGITLGAVESLLSFSKDQLESLRRFNLQESELTNQSAWIAVRLSQLDLQKNEYKQAIEHAERASQSVVGINDYGAMLSYTTALSAKVQALLALERDGEALTVARQMMEATDEFNENYPDRYETRLAQSENLSVLSTAQNRNGEPETALESLAASVRILSGLIKEFPNSATFPMRTAEHLEDMGDIATELQDPVRALAWYIESADWRERYLQYNKTRISAFQTTLEVALKAAEAALQQGKTDEASRMMKIAVGAMNYAKEKLPDNPGVIHNLERAEWMLSKINQGKNPFKQEAEQKTDLEFGRIGALLSRANQHMRRGSEYSEAGEAKDSVQEFIKATDMLRDLAQKGIGGTEAQEMFATSAMLGGANAVDAGDFELAKKLLLEAQDAWKVLAELHPEIAKYADLVTATENTLSAVP